MTVCVSAANPAAARGGITVGGRPSRGDSSFITYAATTGENYEEAAHLPACSPSPPLAGDTSSTTPMSRMRNGGTQSRSLTSAEPPLKGGIKRSERLARGQRSCAWTRKHALHLLQKRYLGRLRCGRRDARTSGGRRQLRRLHVKPSEHRHYSQCSNAQNQPATSGVYLVVLLLAKANSKFGDATHIWYEWINNNKYTYATSVSDLPLDEHLNAGVAVLDRADSALGDLEPGPAPVKPVRTASGPPG